MVARNLLGAPPYPVEKTLKRLGENCRARILNTMQPNFLGGCASTL